MPTTDTVRRYLAQPDAAYGQAVGHAIGLSQQHRFFHWPLEFPDVFAHGGFDVVLGNPPWERIKLQEQEFFAGRDREIAEAPNKAARERLIKKLPEGNPALAQQFAREKHAHEAASRFVRATGRFPLTAMGDVNTYALFAEHSRRLLSPQGRAGLITPTGIATDDVYKGFFRDLIESGALIKLNGFENEAKIFPGVHNEVKFCLLTVGGISVHVADADFMFFARHPEDVLDRERHFRLTTADLILLNPNTSTCPIFRTQRDANITREAYRRVPVLLKEGSPEQNR